MKNTFIRPYRIIPFDIGGDISYGEIESIVGKFNKTGDNKAEILPLDGFQKKLSSRILCGYKVTDNISFFIYSFGIGVFSVRDNDFEIDGMESEYAPGYCRSRKTAHKNILVFEADYSEKLRTVMNFIRGEYANNHRDIRLSASSDWENGGLSYVMTVSYISSGLPDNNYSVMSDTQKHSLQILLTPSLAHEDDSEFIHLPIEKDDSNPYEMNLNSLKTPCDFLNRMGSSIYISWAAVVVMQKEILPAYTDFMNSLEVDLQAMWFYTYCLYGNSKSIFDKKGILASDLKRIENEFEILYNEFLSNDDSSCPQYVSDIRSELIETSGIKTEHDKFVKYIGYCTEEIEALEREHQRKYSWLNEILLFIIAFADIVTTLTVNFVVNFTLFWQVAYAVFSVFVFVFGILFIVKKG